MTIANRNNKRYCSTHHSEEANHWFKNQRVCIICKNDGVIAEHDNVVATLKDAVQAAIKRMNSANGNRDLYQAALRERDLIKKDLKRAEDFAIELRQQASVAGVDLANFQFQRERENRPFVKRNSKVIIPKRLRRLAHQQFVNA